METPTFASRLISLRRKAGLSQSELARRAGVKQAYVSQLESGRRTGPSLGTAVAIAHGLGVTVQQFLECTGVA